MRIRPGTGQLQHPAFPDHQLGMVLLISPASCATPIGGSSIPESNIHLILDLRTDKKAPLRHAADAAVP
jgi:hypothetical protein